MNLIILTEPPVEPVTLAEVYLHLRLDLTPGSPASHPHDTMLTRFIKTARRECEQIAHMAFVSQRLLQVTNGFPATRKVALLRPPVISVLSVAYYDADKALQPIDPANYFLTDEQIPQLQFVPAFSFPAAHARADSLRIEHMAGFAPVGSPPDYAAGVPDEIKAAILLGVELLYQPLTPDQRAALVRARDALLSGPKIYSIA
jgi:uncharacterized phiE125 gp8 family phage protein